MASLCQIIWYEQRFHDNNGDISGLLPSKTQPELTSYFWLNMLQSSPTEIPIFLFDVRLLALCTWLGIQKQQFQGSWRRFLNVFYEDRTLPLTEAVFNWSASKILSAKNRLITHYNIFMPSTKQLTYLNWWWFYFYEENFKEWRAVKYYSVQWFHAGSYNIQENIGLYF